MKAATFTPEQMADVRKRILAGTTAADLAADLKMNRKTVLAAVKRYNLGPWKSRGGPGFVTQRRPVPDDFVIMAAKMSNPELARHYGCGTVLPARWREEAGIPLTVHHRGGKPKAPTPADFTTFAPGRSLRELMAHYGLSSDSIRRMRAENGIVGAPPGWQPKPAAKPAHLVRNAYQTAPVDRPQRDMSAAGQAADVLRRFAPVYRCGPLGAADVAGTHWRYGRVVLSPAELIERAEAKGWSADAWARVA